MKNNQIVFDMSIGMLLFFLCIAAVDADVFKENTRNLHQKKEWTEWYSWFVPIHFQGRAVLAASGSNGITANYRALYPELKEINFVFTNPQNLYKILFVMKKDVTGIKNVPLSFISREYNVRFKKLSDGKHLSDGQFVKANGVCLYFKEVGPSCYVSYQAIRAAGYDIVKP